jgi:hypothetical protein
VDFGHFDAEMHMVFTATGLTVSPFIVCRPSDVCTVDGTNEIAVLGFFIEVSKDSASTPLLENIFAHLDEIHEPGSSTKVPTVDFSDFQTKANEVKY